MRKHTPGPWTVMNSSAIWMIYGPLGERVCRMLSPDMFKMRKANASLISAAPELLEALEEAVEVLGTGKLSDKYAKLIAKAYGK